MSASENKNSTTDDRQVREQGVDLTIIDGIPIPISVLAADGKALYVNPLALENVGFTLEEVKSKGHLGLTCHADDLDRVLDDRRVGLSKGIPFELEMRLRKDGEYRWNLVQYNPLSDESGSAIRWYVTAIDIEDRKRAEQALQRSQFYLREANRLASMGCWALSAAGFDYWSPEMFQIYGLDPGTQAPTANEYLKFIPEEDREFIQQKIRQMLEDRLEFDFTKRIVRPDGEVRYVRCAGSHLIDGSGFQGLVGTAMDVTNQERLMQKLRQSEQDLLAITDSIANPIVILNPDGTRLYANRVAWNQLQLLKGDARNEGCFPGSCHADDFEPVRDKRDAGLLQRVPFELEMRLLRNGEWRWHLSKYNPLKDGSGKVIRWYVTATDIDDRKRAEERLRQSEEDLRIITDTIRHPIAVLAPDGTTLYVNRVLLQLTGRTLDDAIEHGAFPRDFHPDDMDRVKTARQEKLLRGAPFDLEMRLRLNNGQYRWQLFQYEPFKDDHGRIIRWYCTATDIEDRKKTEERLRNENLILREEIDRSSMFEEIVGSSKPVRQVLKHVEKVASSDSTVLILGQTGTGKELIARALHRRSKRANRVFIRVNCAAIPQSLIASELFGHEKGAFTGALQRRVGRFEAANGGTLFLDEIGELPMETQIALLRVLQEKEFERVGSNHPISVDVRVIAATNRDLPAAVAAGTFRRDLFFRLNVFPIAVPSLCERVDDISLLVEYFVARFAKESGKTIRHIGKDTLELLKSYHWPGNIRELQNVVERAVILSETDTFVVDDSWLQCESAESSPKRGLSALDDREVEMIEAALAETHGRISGPTGAAAKLGIPRQTLESKMRRLGIDKYGQRRPPLS